MHLIHLKALDSRYASQEELNATGITPDQIPADWRMMAHQVKTIRAVQSEEAGIIVNEARTGDGKTFAGQFPLFAYGWPTLTMYPTKELADDQQRGLNVLFEKGYVPPQWAKRKLYYEVLNADKLNDLQEKLTQLSRPEALRTLLDNELTLTNPDIFHLMMQLGYSQYGAAKDLVLGEVVNRYRMFVFDEFHQFGSAQAASVMIALLLMREITQGKQTPRFLFLSATPQKFLENMAAKVDLKVERICGEYIHGLPEAQAGWRRILQPAMLNLYPGRLEAWIAEHLEDVILRFYVDYGPAKGVIIANGVATAHRVYAILREPCEKAGIKLGLNTGLTARSERDFNVDLLVATSTIDVGVDFKINLLIFESVDASSHMQRLGRLGRHIKDDDGYEFTHFEAHALLPSWVVDKLAEQVPTESELDRVAYAEKLAEVFIPLQQFEVYAKKWAGVQAGQVLSSLRRPEIRTQYEPYCKRLSEHYKKLFPGMKKYIDLLKDKKQAILDEATSFRGSSPFVALVLDEENRRQGIMPYNLITLLRNGDLESVELRDFYEQAARQGKSVKALKRAKPLAAYKLRGWLPQPRTVEVNIDHELGAEYFDVVLELDRVRLVAPDVPDMNILNRALEERRLVALLTKLAPDELRKRLRLGYQLEIFEFSDTGIERGSVVFGRDALLIDSVLWRKKSSNDSPIIL